MASLDVRVLGPLEVVRDGEVVPLGSRMQRRLLLALVLARPTTVSVDRLADELWDHDPPRSARNSLQTHVARLRGHLGTDEVIVTRPPGYALAADGVRVDADDFEREVAQARILLADDPHAARAMLDRALRRWRGDPYADAGDGLGRTAATRLGMLRADGAELLARAHGALGDHQAALATLDPLLAEDPVRESAVLVRATCLAALGRRPDALATLRQLRHDLAEELGLDPGPAVGALEQQLLQEDPTPTGPSAAPVVPDDGARRATPPPRPATPTVGRDRLVTAIDGALDQGPLVTLVGPGGIGKSRLAMLVAQQRAPACWVDLVEVDHPSAVLGTMLQALGVVQPGGPVRAAVVEALSRFPGLVVVDNCEHLLDPVAAVLDEALLRGGGVRVLATSRERLDLPGEQVVRVDPLPVPDVTLATAADPAVALFTRCVRNAGGPPPSPAEAAAVVAAVDGLPLGIELAATRAATIPVPVLAERLAGRMDLAVASRRRRDHRHGALTNVIRWSHDLLGAPERRLFARLSVFAGPFRLHDVEAVCADDRLPEDEVAVSLGRLVEQSMVSLSQAPGPVTRYRLLQPLRWYARRQLDRQDDPPGEWAALKGRHRDHVLDFADRMWAAVGTPDEVALLAVMPAAMPDVRTVAARAVEHGDLATAARLAGGLYGAGYVQARVDLLQVAQPVAHAWEDDPAQLPDVSPSDIAAAVAAAAMLATFTEQYQLAGRWARQAVALGTTDRSGVAAQEAWGDVCLQTGDRVTALAAYRRQHDLAEALGFTGGMANALAGMALTHIFHGDRGEGTVLARQAVEVAEASGAPSALALARYTTGEALADQDPDAALDALGGARRAAARVGARLFTGVATTAEVALRGRHGPPGEALRQYRSALCDWRETGAVGLALIALRNLVVLLARVGADLEAITLHSSLARLQERDSFGTEARRLDQAVRAARARLGPDGTARARQDAEAVQDLGGAATWALDVVDGLIEAGT